jgi:hypothetical protein
MPAPSRPPTSGAQPGARQSEVQVLRLSVACCTDHGRAIDNVESDWPKTLTGFAAAAYDFYGKELRPLGFELWAAGQNPDPPRRRPGRGRGVPQVVSLGDRVRPTGRRSHPPALAGRL